MMLLMATPATGVTKTSREDDEWKPQYHPNTAPNYSIFQFGFLSSLATVTVTTGEVQWGKTTIIVAETNVEILTNDTYIGVECDGTTANIIQSNSLEDMRSDDEKLRTWLHKWSLDADGNAFVTAIGHLGNIVNPSTYTVP